MQYISFIASLTAAHVSLPLSFNDDVPFSVPSARKSGKAHSTTFSYELGYIEGKSNCMSLLYFYNLQHKRNIHKESTLLYVMTK